MGAKWLDGLIVHVISSRKNVDLDNTHYNFPGMPCLLHLAERKAVF
jgi:hypothetical protein